MQRSVRPILQLLAILSTATTIGCGQIELPVTFGLVGDNTISLYVPAFPPGMNTFSSSMVGGADATVVIDLNPFELLSPQGIVAAISVDYVNIAAEPIVITPLTTGTLCIYDDVDNPGGGFAFLRPLHNEADFTLTLNTLITPTDPFILTLFTQPLPFVATIDETVPLTLADLLGLLGGGGGAGLELSQHLESVLPPEVPLLGGSTVSVDVTLATMDAFPVDPLLDECTAFLAGP